MEEAKKIKIMPTIGALVTYWTTEEERMLLKQFGNESKELPAIIVAVWGEDCVNLRVFPDANMPEIWKTSISQYDKDTGLIENCWDWVITRLNPKK